MAFMELHGYSAVMNLAVSVNVILPEADQGIGVRAGTGEGLPKVLYLLHGYSDDHTIWMRRTSVERYAAGKNLAVIMPAVNHSYYINEWMGERYWDYVSQELPQMIGRFFRVSTKPEDTYAAGLSMGGYGAMRLALTYPERFAAAASFSGAVDIIRPIRNSIKADQEGICRLFAHPDRAAGSEVDLFAMMKKNGSAPHKPKLLIACGKEDFLYDENARFYPALKAAGWDADWSEKPDTGHSWSYWDEMIQVFIRDYIR